MATKKSSADAAFTKATFDYLRDLEDNNDKAFFESNRDRYEAFVREPALAFIRAMAPRLKKAGVPLMADDRKAGGSLMRVNKDVRFSKDKKPYKTNVGIQFRHPGGKDVHAPGLYLHVSNEECFLGLGMWHPESGALNAIRARIDARSRIYSKVIGDAKLQKVWRQGGDSLKRPPRGFTPDHPLSLELQRKDHILIGDLKRTDVCSAKLVDLVSERLMAGKPYLMFLTEAIEQ